MHCPVGGKRFVPARGRLRRRFKQSAQCRRVAKVGVGQRIQPCQSLAHGEQRPGQKLDEANRLVYRWVVGRRGDFGAKVEGRGEHIREACHHDHTGGESGSLREETERSKWREAAMKECEESEMGEASWGMRGPLSSGRLCEEAHVVHGTYL